MLLSPKTQVNPNLSFVVSEVCVFKFPIVPNSGDSHQTSAFWFAVIVPFEHVRTADKDKIADLNNNVGDVSGFTGDEAIKTKDPFLVTNQIVNWQVRSTKSSPMLMASFRLAPGKYDWTRITHAGDWAMLWAFDNARDYAAGIKRVSALIKGRGTVEEGADFIEPFNSGLKFLGRLNSPRQRESVDPNTGRKEVSYELTAHGFGEFNSQMAFHPSFNDKNAVEKDSALSALAQIGRLMYLYASDGQALSTEAWQQYILDAFLGEGASQREDASPKDLGDNKLFKNGRLIIPPVVPHLLGIPDGDEGHRQQPVYAKILNCFMGIQQSLTDDGFESFLGTGDSSAGASSDHPYKGYAFDKLTYLTGVFPPSLAQFQNSTCWQMLQIFSHKPINESYVTLRADAHGRIVPTYVIRQSPFSSQEFKLKSGVECTAFVELPRWVVDSRMVLAKDVGPSDSYRVNYSMTTGASYATDNLLSGQDIKQALSPPAYCSADILRNGIRMKTDETYSRITPNNWAADSGLGPARPNDKKNVMNKFMADILMDMHLKWSGSLTLKGVQQPICIGDNLEFEDVIYHIEDVSHMGHIETATGRKHFTTTVQLSSGISTESDTKAHTVYPHEDSRHGHGHHDLNFESSKDVVDTELINDKAAKPGH